MFVNFVNFVMTPQRGFEQGRDLWTEHKQSRSLAIKQPFLEISFTLLVLNAEIPYGCSSEPEVVSRKRAWVSLFWLRRGEKAAGRARVQIQVITGDRGGDSHRGREPKCAGRLLPFCVGLS